MHNSRAKFRLLVALTPFVAVALAGILGCGSGELPKARVHGDVKYDGKTVEHGLIGFYPVNGIGPTAGAEIKQGQYSLTVTPGMKRVEVRGFKDVGKKNADGEDVSVDYIPASYNTSSTLNKEVTMPESTIDLDLAPVAGK